MSINRLNHGEEKGDLLEAPQKKLKLRRGASYGSSEAGKLLGMHGFASDEESKSTTVLLKLVQAMSIGDNFLSTETMLLVYNSLTNGKEESFSTEKFLKRIDNFLLRPKTAKRLDLEQRKQIYSSIAADINNPYLLFRDPERELAAKWVHCKELEGQKRDFWYSQATQRLQFDIPQEFDLESDEGKRLKPFQGLWTYQDPKTIDETKIEIEGNLCIWNDDYTATESERIIFRNDYDTGWDICYLDWILDQKRSDRKANMFWTRKIKGIVEERTWNRKAPTILPNSTETTDEQIEEMVRFKKSSYWDFENQRVRNYRAICLEKDYESYLSDSFLNIYPQYLAKTLPIGGQTVCFCRVSTPEGYSPQAWIKMKVDMNQTARDLIELIIAKKLEKSKRDIPPEEFIFKAKGLEAYLHLDECITANEYIRRGLRDDTEVYLVLIHEPKMKELKIEANEARKRLVENFPHVYGEDYKNESRTIEITKEWRKSQWVPNNSHNPFNRTDHILLHECDCDFYIKIVELEGLSNLSNFDPTKSKSIGVRLEVSIGKLKYDDLCHTESECSYSLSDSESWLDFVFFDQTLYSKTKDGKFLNLRRETMITLFLVSTNNKQETQDLCYLRIPLIDMMDRLQSGMQTLAMWEIDLKRKSLLSAIRGWGAVGPNLTKDRVCWLTVEFPCFNHIVIAPKYPPKCEEKKNDEVPKKKDRKKKEWQHRLESILDKKPDPKGVELTDSIINPTEEDIKWLWENRGSLVHIPNALPLFLKAVDWRKADAQAEAHRLLRIWKSDDPEMCLQLLNWDYQDTLVREYAIAQLEQLDDADLQTFLLQCIQILKFETHHDSALSRFLMRRALRARQQIGHYFYWGMKAEYHSDNPETLERFGLLLEEFLRHSQPEYVRNLLIQERLVNRLEYIAAQILDEKKRGVQMMDRKTKLVDLLEKLNDDLPEKVVIPLNPRMVARKIIPQSSRFMSSKQVPLWLTFENACNEGKAIKVLFKSGDDLRQDILTIQMLRLMDRHWLAKGEDLDLKMLTYDVLAMGVNKNGEGIGMLELVVPSKPINSIYKDSDSTAMYKTFNQMAIVNHIYEKNVDTFGDSQKLFARSSAGFAIATYLLGIGDRHSDNILIGERGHLFHIDFGHFLGNFKSKAGIKRERCKLVFTGTMKQVIDADPKNPSRRSSSKRGQTKLYKEFEENCWRALKIMRDKYKLLISLFLLMVPANMPELLEVADIDYLVKMLMLNLNEKSAKDAVVGEIHRSIKDNFRKFDDLAHYIKHA